MTELPPAPTFETPPTQPGQFAGWVAWAVIFGAVGFILWRNSERATEPAGAVSPTVEIQFTMAGKYAIGTKALITSLSTTQPTTSTASATMPLMQQIDSLATSPRQKLRAAIIDAELENAPAAVHRLEELDKDDLSEPLRRDISDLRSIYAGRADTLDEAARQRLIDRHAYFGQVAVSFGLPATDEHRRQVLQQGQFAMLVMFSMAIGGIIFALAGLALFITAIVLAAVGSLRFRYVRQPDAGTVYVEMFAVYLAVYLLLGLLIRLVTDGQLSLVWEWAIAPVVAVVLGWGLLRGVRWSELRQSIGWHGGQGWFVEILLGLAGYFAGLPIIAIGIGATIFLVKATGASPSHPILSMTGHRSIWDILLLYSIASVWAPVIEETMFRGALFHHLRRRWGWMISATVVAILFAIIHPQGWTTVPALAAIAIVLAGLREWRGSILAPMTAHAFHNGILITLLVLMT